MGRIKNNTPNQTSGQVTQAQQQVDAANSQLRDVAIEVAKLAGSSVPGLGTVIDIKSGWDNVLAGNYFEAIVDGVGIVPFGGDAVKGVLRGAKIAKAVKKAKNALNVAQAALTRAKSLAKTRAAAKTYWDAIRKRREAILGKYKGCKTGKCAADRDAELRKVTRLPKTGGKWVNKDGKPVAAGFGYWKPDAGTPLHTTLSRHQNPVRGVPFKDGNPDFSGFPPGGMTKVHQVDIEMKGNSTSDISDAKRKLIEQGGPNTNGSGQPGTWHHEPNGTTMSYVDKDVHTAYQRADGSANPGTPHAGGDSMTRDPEF